MLLPVYFVASMKSFLFFVVRGKKIFRRTPKNVEGVKGSPLLFCSNLLLCLISLIVLAYFRTCLSLVVFSVYMVCLLVFFNKK
jgi:hypothetical protein